MPLRIDIEKLRLGDIALVIDHRSTLFDLDDEDWTFDEQVRGEVNFHLSNHDIFARGTLQVCATGRCYRCLAPVPVEVEVPINYIYHPQAEEPTQDVVHEHVSERAPDLAYYGGERLDPLNELRESILLAMPRFPRCPTCEAETDPVVHHEEFPEETAEAGVPEWKRKLRELRGAG